MTQSAKVKVSEKTPLPRTPGTKLSKRNSSPNLSRTAKPSKNPEPETDPDELISMRLKQISDRFKQK